MKRSLTEATRKFIRDPLKSLDQYLKKDYLNIYLIETLIVIITLVSGIL